MSSWGWRVVGVQVRLEQRVRGRALLDGHQLGAHLRVPDRIDVQTYGSNDS